MNDKHFPCSASVLIIIRGISMMVGDKLVTSNVPFHSQNTLPQLSRLFFISCICAKICFKVRLHYCPVCVFSPSVSTPRSTTTSPSGCRRAERARQGKKASRRMTSTSWCAPLGETWWRKSRWWTNSHTQSRRTHTDTLLFYESIAPLNTSHSLSTKMSFS